MARFAIIDAGRVTNIIEADADFAATIGAIDATGAAIGDSWDGAQFHKPPPAPVDPVVLRSEIVSATQARLDAFAQTRAYDSILSACTYSTSSVLRFAVEGQAAVNARDATWAALYALLAQVELGAVPMPASFADVEPTLPVLEWPV